MCDEKEPAVKALLDRLYYGIQQAHEDMDSAEPGGSPAYRTFLGGVNPNNVRSLFSQIAAGSNLEFNGGRFHPPEIACVHPRHKSLMPRQWAHCSDGAREGVAAMWEKSTHSIFLCPYFWIFPSSPTEDKCPQVVQAGTRFDKSNIIETQMNVLFHELLHLHMGYPMLEPEAYGINKCANLPPHLSVINVSNYDYYLGCMYFDTYSIPWSEFDINLIILGGSSHSRLLSIPYLP